ncbi:MAG TPA: PKD domain-containing protein [Flavobacteriales bacterium]
MRHLLSLVLFLLAALARPAHIIGGEMYYTHVSGNTYEVTLKLYRECSSTAFDFTASIGAFDVGNQWVGDWAFDLDGEEEIPIETGNPCMTAPPDLCISMGTYIGLIDLPPIQGGYTLSYQRCCRTPDITNLFDPGTQGITCRVDIPDAAAVGDNSSPAFQYYPPIALCLNEPMVIDHSALDADGDDLVYEICAPFIGGTTIAPTPAPPAAPPYDEVSWAPGFSVGNIITASPALVMDANTGVFTFTPTQLGQFVIGVRVKEYRNGVLLGSVVRDFLFEVVACTAGIVSVIEDNTEEVRCTGLTVPFGNNSLGGDFYHWDFGVAGTDADTSNLEQPTFTFPAEGFYTVTLVVNPTWACGDTTVLTYELRNPLTIDFEAPPILCPDQLPVTLEAEGNFTALASVQWTYPGGFSPDPTAHGLDLTYATLGTHMVSVQVEEHGCEAEYTDSVRIMAPPVALFVSDTNGCVPFTTAFVDQSTGSTPLRYLWDLGDGTLSTDSIPVHTYTEPGVYDVRLTVSTDSGCIASSTLLLTDQVSVWPQPIARFMVDPLVTDLMDPNITVYDQSEDAEQLLYEVEGVQYTVPEFAHLFNDGGWHDVVLTAVSGLGCVDTAVTRVFVGDHLFYAPNTFTPNGDGINDSWLPQVKGARKYKLEVFDRWGHSVFETTDPDRSWDGSGAGQGIYHYRAWLTEYGPLEREYRGSVSLLR